MQIPETEITVRDGRGTLLLQRALRPGEYVMGRSPEAELSFDAELVCDEHARLTVNYDHVLIEDLDSAWGTFVDGKPVKGATRLWPGQTIQIGPVNIECRRIKRPPGRNGSFAPNTAGIRQMLPEDLLSERKYRISGMVAQGGMGAILDATEQVIQRKVAMKVMLDGSDPQGLARFISEAKITARLEHPNIVPVHELSVDENEQAFYTMKLVRGITLHKVLRLMRDGAEPTLRKYSLGVLLTIFQKVCDALAFAHSKGVIHRDLKPDNVMLGDFGEVLVMDWGLAKTLGAQSPAEPKDSGAASRDWRDPSGSGTEAGTIMGTPKFMSPEQARGEVETLDARSDIYALGAMLYEILCLRSPVSGANASEIVERVGTGQVDPITAPNPGKISHLPGAKIPDSLSAVVRKAMAFKRTHRYASVADLQRDIEAYQNGFATSAEQKSLWKDAVFLVRRNKVASLGILAVLLVGGGLGANVFTTGRRAEGALKRLREMAPALRAMADKEAEFQRFPAALEKLDAAITLDPDYGPAYTRKAWIHVGMKDMPTAATLLRKATLKDPKADALLPLFERLSAKPIPQWSAADRQELLTDLRRFGLDGESIALLPDLKTHSQDAFKLIRDRVGRWLGPNQSWRVKTDELGLIRVELPTSVRSLIPLQGLPIQSLSFYGSNVSDLTPLRGMPLSVLDLHDSKVSDLTPLAGMPLSELFIHSTPVTSLEPLRGMELKKLNADNCKIRDFSPLQGMPLQELTLGGYDAIIDLALLDAAPLTHLKLRTLTPQNTEVLQTKNIVYLNLEYSKIPSIAALRGLPVKTLRINRCDQLKDLSPLADLPELEELYISQKARLPDTLRNHAKLKWVFVDPATIPIAIGDYWAEVDRQQSPGK
jgi:serine/threonine protein kinase